MVLIVSTNRDIGPCVPWRIDSYSYLGTGP